MVKQVHLERSELTVFIKTKQRAPFSEIFDFNFNKRQIAKVADVYDKSKQSCHQFIFFGKYLLPKKMFGTKQNWWRKQFERDYKKTWQAPQSLMRSLAGSGVQMRVVFSFAKFETRPLQPFFLSQPVSKLMWRHKVVKSNCREFQAFIKCGIWTVQLRGAC